MQSILAVAVTIWGLLMAVAPLLQVRLILRQRDSTGVSAAWPAILLVGFILWLSYGVVLGNLPLILTNCVSCAASALTVGVILRFRGAASRAEAGGPGQRAAVTGYQAPDSGS
jgi:MtN3 and saliva related transmembrane protein